MKHNLLKSVIISVILLMGVSNAWGWNPVYLIGDPTNNWTSNKTSYVISNNKDEASAYFYFAKDNHFAVYIGYYDEQAGPDSDGAEMNTGASGKQFFIWDSGANSNSAKYVGNNGIVEVHAKQKDFGDDRPWIWLTRPEIKVKHGWNGRDWTEQTMIDNSDGTYSYTGLYSGANQTNFGLGSDGKTMKYITNATLVGSPSKGNKCLFTYNSAGYKGYGTETQNTGSATITRLYTITYNGNGHTGGNVPEAVDKKHGTNITLSSSTPTRTGYNFVGWNTKADETGITYAAGATYSTNADVTLYAQWEEVECELLLAQGNTQAKWDTKVSITLYVKYGTSAVYSKNADGTIQYGVIFPTQVKTGYSCVGYCDAAMPDDVIFIDKNGTLLSGVKKGNTYYTDANGNWVKTRPTTMIPKLAANQYLITFNKNGGTFTANGKTQVYATYNETVPNIGNGRDDIPWRHGYAFNGYNDEADGTGNQYYNENGVGLITYNKTKETTVYAQWALETYSITYELNGGTNHANNPNTYTYEDATITLQEPTKTGYTFNGWYDNSSFTGTPITRISKGSYGNKTLYAKWTANTYTVTLDQQSGTGGTTSVTATYGAAMPAITKPTRNAYTFGGYYTAINGGGTQYYNANGGSSKAWNIANNTTLYAKWTATNYTVTYNTNGGNSIAQKTYTIETATFNLPTPTRTGYTFAGWYDNANLTGNKVTQVAKGSTGNKTFYAAWTAMAPNTLYLRPVDFWPADNARFAVYAWNTSSNQWFDMADVGCVREYFKVDLPAEYSNFKFVRLNPETNNNNFDNGNAWNQTSDLTLSNEGNLYTTPRIYLRPSEKWKTDGARFAAYFFQKDGETTSHECWMSMFSNDGGEVYWCNIPNHSHNYVIFCRMKPEIIDNDFSNAWNQTGDLSILPEHNNNGNCFNMTGTEWEITGTWSTYWETYSPPTYTVTLEKTTYGKYAVELNGQKYYSSQSEDVVINNVPVESTLRLVSSESFNAAYNNNMCIQTHDGVDFEELNAEHRICGNTVIKENFTTLKAHTVYLRVSTIDNEINNNWNQGGDNYIYSDNNIGGQVITTTSLPDGEIYKEIGYNYYKFIIPAGCRTFRFERKNGPNVYYTSNTENFLRYLPLGTSNCYTIEKKISDNTDGTKTFNGSWGMSLANGDYRLLYVEQVVTNGDGNDSWKTVIKNTYQHSSDIIKKRAVTGTDIVSLHINYDETKHPRIILQQFSNGNWVDVEGEARMAVGPLTANPGRAMLPGRRNTESLTHDDGIEEIKQDKAVNGYAGRVWNFTVQQTVDNGNVTANLLFDPINAMEGRNLEPYSGNYYIRTDNAEGGWMDYTIPDNHMHFSQYALENSGFSHYFCKWVETKKNTKFVIANDYGAAISDTLSKDDYTDEHGNIADDANIRWSWNEYTNEAARAYIQGTWQTGTKNRNRNLVVNYKASSSTGAKEELLDDSGDWIYQKDFTVKVGSHLNSLTAQYPVTTGPIQTFAENLDMLTGDNTNDNAYVVRVLYDFKINKTLIALVPNEHKAEIAIDVMIERTNQEPATQVRADITYTNNQRSGEGSTVYAVMSFTKAHLTNEELSNEEKLTYWFSVPFNVTLSDVFGFGEVGQYWMIKYYDGEDRADRGLIDDNTFWKYITKKSTVLQANTGYVLALNKKVMDPNSPIFTNTDKISLYFPSTEPIQMIGTGYTVENCTIPSHTCTLQNREIYDSNWNFIGVPSYADKNITTNTTNVKYFYDYNHKTDKYTVTQNVNSKTFNSMFAYMVQFAGIINWESFDFNEGAQGLAAKRNTDSDAKQHNLRLELQQNGTTADKTFIQLQDEDATEMFDMNSDLCKIINTGSNIYSIINTESTPIQVAGNVMPIQETVIPLGVVSAAAGEYTFAMPDGTDGIVVELIDYENNTRTNMLLDNYTVKLGKGTFENRFALHVQPSKVTTSVEDINTNSNGVKKYLIDGVLYMQKDGVLYDAQGKLVR